mgnify:CR=1 FL=1
MPDNVFLKYWNILMIFLLIYVAIWVPYNICLTSNDDINKMSAFRYIMYIVDIIADILFFCDLIVNFISAYDDMETGLPEIKLKKIASNYVTGWFSLDFIAILPIEQIQSFLGNESEGGSELKLARIARLPRMYRLIRILRMIKMLKFITRRKQISTLIDSKVVNRHYVRLVKVIGLSMFLHHIVACFWFLGASL